jgi:hypothetical protein
MENEYNSNETAQSSIEININAKGQYAIKFKIYDKDIDVAIEKAMIKASAMEALIKSKNEI